MAKFVTGEVDWNQDFFGGGEDRGSDFLVLEEGDNKVRILSNPVQFYVHWISDTTGANKKVRCAVDNCPVCRKGESKAQARWYVKVLERASGVMKICEIGSQVYKGVKSLAGDPDWGPVVDYDINIKRGPKGSQPLYNVVPGRRSPLTSDEKQLAHAFSEKVDLVKIAKVPTPEEVMEKLGWSSDKQESKSNGSSVSNDFKSNPQKKPTIDFDF